jgi:antitoxin component of RelBE/YafQ-DinJ toxin-antitoxin module
MMTKQSTLTIRIPEEIKEKAKQKAQTEGETLSTVIRRI